MINNLLINWSISDVVNYLKTEMTDADALNAIPLFDEWQTEKSYEVGDRVSFNGILFKCLMAHDSQDTWTPSDSPSLWVRVDDPSIEFPEWVQPLGSTDAYRLGDKVSHLGKHWISTIDYNTYEPGVVGENIWREI